MVPEESLAKPLTKLAENISLAVKDTNSLTSSSELKLDDTILQSIDTIERTEQDHKIVSETSSEQCTHYNSPEMSPEEHQITLHIKSNKELDTTQSVDQSSVSKIKTLTDITNTNAKIDITFQTPQIQDISEAVSSIDKVLCCLCLITSLSESVFC